MKKLFHKTILIILLILFYQNIFSQQNEGPKQNPTIEQQISSQIKSKRPKIGLTLSGGGAKGLAHIGILQAIDSAGLKIDYITGTSMGSVIGGLYAVGYSGDSIETISRKLDWPLLFSTSPKLGAISIEEKDEFDKYALEIPFQKGKFKIGKGIIEGQELWLKLAELFAPAYNITNYNKLSIPFNCIGTDLSTGSPVVMSKGNIINSVRASMAIPTIFTPVQYEGKTLVDGGIVNNFPVLDVKNMGADYVIGVNLNKDNGLAKAEELETVFDVLLQLTFFKDADNFARNRAKCNIFILPDLKGNSTGDFDKSDSIIDIGKKYGRLYYPVFKHLADSLNALYPDENTFKKDRLPKAKNIIISKYSVTGLVNTTEKFFFGISGLNTEKEFSYQKIAEAIRKIYGSRYYRKINYDFVTQKDGSVEMIFRVEENPLASIKFALNYNNYTKINLIFNGTARDFIIKESRSTATISLSENPRIFLEFYKYLGSSRKFGLNTAYYRENVDFPVYQNFKLLETIRSKYSYIDVRGQYNINNNSYIGLSQQYTNSDIKTPNPILIDFEGHNKFWYTYLSYRFINIDKKHFSSSGWNIKTDVGYIYNQNGSVSIQQKDKVTINADSLGISYKDLIRWTVKAEHFTPIGKKFVLIENAVFAMMFNKSPYLANSFQVGGIGQNVVNQVQFAGLNESQLKTGSILSGQIGLQYKLSNSTYLTGRVNAAVYNFYKESINTLNYENNSLTGCSLTLGIMTPIGPVEVSGMYSTQVGKILPNLNLGYRF